MIDSILLFPYWISLKIRHLLYDKGIRKVHRAEVPTICVGNITAGGTGKTPHTEMILRELLAQSAWKGSNISVLSRGYKRKTKGFQQVTVDSSARDYGDEPLQIKSKFPEITVAVDKSRVEGCRFLVHPEELLSDKKARKCKNKEMQASDLIILDDAFQHRSLKASVSIVLVDSHRPLFRDHLIPLGRLRDLPERAGDADILIVTKCPHDMNGWEKSSWAEALGINDYDPLQCKGHNTKGRVQYLFFTEIVYDTAQPVFPEGDSRYLYAKKVILFTGIANDAPLQRFLSSSYRLAHHFNFPDHHSFTRRDLSKIKSASLQWPTSVLITTEKDSQRLRECKYVCNELKQRMFYVPIKAEFICDGDKDIFINLLNGLRK